MRAASGYRSTGSRSTVPRRQPHMEVDQAQAQPRTDESEDLKQRIDLDPELMVIDPPRSRTATRPFARCVSVMNPSNDAGTESSETPASEDSMDILRLFEGAHTKKLSQLMRDLIHSGIEQIVLPLPKVCVVGDQSTGKSSLIEGMSGIKVPRDSGTCTRCPLEINLSENDDPEEPWTCNIFLTYKYLYEPPPRGSKLTGSTSNQPLGPWMERNPENSHFATVKSKDEVSSALRWAQLAILNPGTSIDKYKPGFNTRTLETLEVKFSPNIVRVDISGSKLPNLSFYDLPGVINNYEVDEERYLVSLVKALVMQYVEQENCNIVLALPMTDDPANSNALAIIKELEAQSRTVGVLTKPDRIQQGESLKQWSEILDGQKFKFGCGYHVVKNNPNPAVDHATARAEEKDFFEGTPPYSTDWLEHRDRFGTLQLQETLSQKLTAQIIRSLPDIREQILNKAKEVEEELSKLPKPPKGNQCGLVIQRLATFTQNLVKHVDGGSAEHQLFNNWHREAKRFCDQLISSAPIAYTRSAPHPTREAAAAPTTPTHRGNSQPEAIQVDSDDNRDDIPRSAKRRKVASPTPSHTPSKKRDVPAIPTYSATSHTSATRFAFLDIRKTIEAFNTGMPASRDPRITQSLYKSSTGHWKRLKREFLEHTRVLCQNVLADGISDVFGLWEVTDLYKLIQTTCQEFLDRAVAEQEEFVDQMLEMDMFKAMTLNREGKEEAERKALVELKENRRMARACAKLRDEERHKGKEPDEAKLKERAAKTEEKDLGTDPWTAEIQEMATLRGYYKYAALRFADNVALSINSGLFQKIRNDLNNALYNALHLGEPDANEYCTILLAVDPEIEKHRQQLLKHQTAVMNAKSMLEKLAAEARADLGMPDRRGH